MIKQLEVVLARTITAIAFASVVSLAAACAGADAKGPERTTQPEQLVQVPASELHFTPFFPGGPEDAFVIGSREGRTGPTAFFIKFAAGFDSGWHTHESAYTGVVLQGTILETSKGSAAAKPLVPGSYYFQPAVVHKTVCAAGADCLMYIYEDGPFSFTPTDEAGNPLPPAKQ